MYTTVVSSNTCFVDFISVVRHTQRDIVNDIDKYDLSVDGKININKNDIQRIFYFYILKCVCDVVMKSDSNERHVFVYNQNCVDVDNVDLHDRLSDVDAYRLFLSRLVNKVNNILPTQFYTRHDSVCFDQLMSNTKSGEYRDFLSDVYSQQMKFYNRSFTFESAKKFIKRYGLTYLDDEYFSKVKIKSLMYK